MNRELQEAADKVRVARATAAIRQTESSKRELADALEAFNRLAEAVVNKGASDAQR